MKQRLDRDVRGMKGNLCSACASLDAGWRDAPMSVVDAGTRWLDNGDQNTLRAALERRQYRVQRYYSLVREQRTAIANECAERHRQPVQLELFEAAA